MRRYPLLLIALLAAMTCISCQDTLVKILKPKDCPTKPPDQVNRCCCSDGAGEYWIPCTKEAFKNCPGATANELDAPCVCDGTQQTGANRLQPSAFRLAELHTGSECMQLCEQGDATCLLAFTLSKKQQQQFSTLISRTRAQQPVTITAKEMGAIFGLASNDPSLAYRKNTTIVNDILTNVGEPTLLQVSASGEDFNIAIPEVVTARFAGTPTTTQVTFSDNSMPRLDFADPSYQLAYGGLITRLDATPQRLVATTERACLEFPLGQTSYGQKSARLLRALRYLDTVAPNEQEAK